MDLVASASEKSVVMDLKANQYLDKYNVPEILRSIISGLMMETPDDHLAYIKEKLLECKKVEDKLDITWEKFIYHLHPYRNERRLELIHDYSSFYVEYLVKKGEPVPAVITFDSALHAYDRCEVYRPEVFKLTETSPEPE